MLITKIYIFFEIEAKLRNFAKICKFWKFWSAILNTYWVAIFTKNYTSTTRTKIKTFWNFDKNQMIFTTDLAVRVRYLIFNELRFSPKTIQQRHLLKKRYSEILIKIQYYIRLISWFAWDIQFFLVWRHQYHMTSFFSLKTIENALIISNIKFHQNRLVRSRDIDVLV